MSKERLYLFDTTLRGRPPASAEAPRTDKAEYPVARKGRA
jgi:hypothetical protein